MTTGIEVIDTEHHFLEYSRFTSFIEQYARLSATDWRGGFLRKLLEQDTNRAQQLIDYTDALVDPSSLVFRSFRSRLRAAVENGDTLIFATQSDGHDSVVTGVARTRVYVPRNPLKRRYGYAPDLLLQSDLANSPAGRDLVSKAHEVTGSNRLVVDAYLNHDQHASDLMQLGFEPIGTQTWTTPHQLGHILGATYQVRQFQHAR